jgi:hypothetical protein
MQEVTFAGGPAYQGSSTEKSPDHYSFLCKNTYLYLGLSTCINNNCSLQADEQNSYYQVSHLGLFPYESEITPGYQKSITGQSI